MSIQTQEYNAMSEIINIDAGSDGDHIQEDQDENPVDTLSQNQYNIPNTTDMQVTTNIDDCTAGYNPNGDVEMKEAEEDNNGDDARNIKDDDNSTKELDKRYPRRNRKKKDTYEPSFGGKQYSYQHNTMLIHMVPWVATTVTYKTHRYLP